MLIRTEGHVEYTNVNLLPKYVIENKKKKYFNINTPNHYIFLCVLIDEFYVKGYSTRSEANNNPVNLFYKDHEILLHYDDVNNKFIIPITRESFAEVETISELKKELNSLILYDSNYLIKAKEYKWE